MRGEYTVSADQMYWEARAEYADGTEIERNFAYDERRSDGDQQYDIEAWLIERHEDCTYYSVNIVYI